MTTKKFRVLLAEAASDEAALALRALYPDEASGCAITIVSSVATLFASLPLVQPDAILLDLSLARPDPLATVRRIQQAAPRVPLFVLADPADKGLAALSLAEGARDYFLKGQLDACTLDRALRATLERNIPDPADPASRDPLTGLYNRRGFLDCAARRYQAALQRGGTLVLLWAAVDGLAEISEAFGPGETQNALREAGKILIASFRRTDLVARVDEDQFAVLAIDAVEPSAPILRRRIENRLKICNGTPARRYPLALHLGIQFWFPKAGRTLEDLIAAASAQLCAAAVRSKP